jgi:hypothetical protein
MKARPPFMSDEEADRTWQQGNDRLFPQTPKTTVELEHLIAELQHRLDQQRSEDFKIAPKLNTEPQLPDPPRTRVLRKRNTPKDASNSSAKAPRVTKSKTTAHSRKQKSQQIMLPVSEGLSAANTKHENTDALVVDTGASHVLFRNKHAHLLSHVQWSSFKQAPYAILRAANGQVLNSI